jgi:hypothetical protein
MRHRAGVLGHSERVVGNAIWDTRTVAYVEVLTRHSRNSPLSTPDHVK